MGLIEKAAGAFGEPPDEAFEADDAASSSFFDLDFLTLAAHGFYSPADRSSRLSLELRAIKRNLLRRAGFRNAAGDPRIQRKGGRRRNLVLITSARPGEGKSFLAINLALSLACEDDLDVLLIDADAPRPKIRANFGLKDGPGLLDRLADPKIPISSVVARARQAPLSIMGEGKAARKPADLFASADAQRFFTELSLRRAGRLVLIDAPPVLPTTDAIVLARHVDEAIFVVEADATPHAAVAAALDELLDANPNVSLLLNRCLIGASGGYYESYGDYGRAAGQTPPPTASTDDD
jgi:Mrp family chromosome partitioning ATPase